MTSKALKCHLIEIESELLSQGFKIDFGKLKSKPDGKSETVFHFCYETPQEKYIENHLSISLFKV